MKKDIFFAITYLLVNCIVFWIISNHYFQHYASINILMSLLLSGILDVKNLYILY